MQFLFVARTLSGTAVSVHRTAVKVASTAVWLVQWHCSECPQNSNESGLHCCLAPSTPKNPEQFQWLGHFIPFLKNKQENPCYFLFAFNICPNNSLTHLNCVCLECVPLVCRPLYYINFKGCGIIQPRSIKTTGRTNTATGNSLHISI